MIFNSRQEFYEGFFSNYFRYSRLSETLHDRHHGREFRGKVIRLLGSLLFDKAPILRYTTWNDKHTAILGRKDDNVAFLETSGHVLTKDKFIKYPTYADPNIPVVTLGDNSINITFDKPGYQLIKNNIQVITKPIAFNAGQPLVDPLNTWRPVSEKCFMRCASSDWNPTCFSVTETERFIGGLVRPGQEGEFVSIPLKQLEYLFQQLAILGFKPTRSSCDSLFVVGELSNATTIVDSFVFEFKNDDPASNLLAVILNLET